MLITNCYTGTFLLGDEYKNRKGLVYSRRA